MLVSVLFELLNVCVHGRHRSLKSDGGDARHCLFLLNSLALRLPPLLSLQASAILTSSWLSFVGLWQVIGQGAIASPMFALKGPQMVKSTYSPAFPLKHQQKVKWCPSFTQFHSLCIVVSLLTKDL